MTLAGYYKMTYISDCLVHCLKSYHNFLSVHSQNPLRVSEVVHESSTRISVIVPGHPDSPSRGRTDNTNNICNGVLAESNKVRRYSWAVIRHIKADATHVANTLSQGAALTTFPLRKNVPFVQGIAFFKKRGST